MSNFLKQAYHHGQQHALAEFGLLGRTKTAYLPPRSALAEYLGQPLFRHSGAALTGAGVGALADDDSALEGALIGGLGGLGLNALGGLGRIERMRKLPDIGPPSIEGALLRGGLGGLGATGVSNMIDDDDESVLALLGLA